MTAPVRSASVELALNEQLFFHGHPSWLSMIAFHIKGLLAAIAAGIVAGLVGAATSGSVQAGWVVLAVFLVFLLMLGGGLLHRRRTTYTITSRRLTIETGLVARAVHETRLEQIQNVSARQSPLERLLGVGTVGFDTAGGAAFDFSFAGVADPHGIVRAVDHALHERALGRV
jgi:uncharacterized membrane protein YdbT with pleckstrin-like domain